MKESSNWLVHDHRKYEAALEECVLAAAAGAWKDVARLFYRFVDDLKLHMRMEDEVLYPLFTEEFGDAEDAIAELNEEHDRLARLLHDMAYVVKTEDYDHLEVSLKPLYRAMAEHNAHEEAVFQRLGTGSVLMRREEIMARLNAMHNEGNRRSWDF